MTRLCLLLALPVLGGGTVFECRDADGRTRLTNRGCRSDETTVFEKTLPARIAAASPLPAAPVVPAASVVLAASAAPAAPAAPAPPALRYTVRNLTDVMAWSAAGGWRVLRPISDSERATVRRAVEEFNRLAGLRLKLDYAEDDAQEARLRSEGAQQGRVEVSWAEDAPQGGLPPPYMWRGKSYVTLGSASMKKAEGLPAAAPPGAPPGQASAGGKVWLIEFSDRIRGLYKCKADGPVYVTLHELGHALGLGHDTPAPSIMHGTCGTAFFPNDLAGFRYAFGVR